MQQGIQGHSAVYYEYENKIIVFGGLYDNENYSHETYVYDILSMEWSSPDVSF